MPKDVIGKLESEIWSHYFQLSPATAVFLGLHEYDGIVPNYTVAFTDQWVKKAEGLVKEISEVDPVTLAQRQRLDTEILTVLLEGALMDFKGYPYFDKLPSVYVFPLALVPYMSRQYAPAEERAASIVKILKGAPKLLMTAEKRLDAPLPRPFITVGLSAAKGMVSHFNDASAYVKQVAPGLSSECDSAHDDASAAIGKFCAYLEKENARATDDFALGADRFNRLMRVKERLDLSNDELWKMGWDDLKRNQKRLAELSESIGFSGKPREAVHSFAEDHPSAETLLEEARKGVSEVREYLYKKDIVSIPAPDKCRVEETPSFERTTTTAALNPAAPFDKGEKESIYYVTPVDPTWDEKKKKEWLEYFNRPLFRNVTVHEVYPGHHLQFLHQSRAPTMTGKGFMSSSFCEGWAHYTEELMIELGLGGCDPNAELAQLHDALLRDCRLLAAIGMHTRGMSISEATELFVREAYFDRFPAEREALRGTFNPEYFCYTLGKLIILDLRKAYLHRHPRSTLKEFHDLLLSHGSPPVGLLKGLIL
jgi:uncharacterized protein (DUF885 family)